MYAEQLSLVSARKDASYEIGQII